VVNGNLAGAAVFPDRFPDADEALVRACIHAEVDLLLTGKDGTESWVEMGGCGRVDPNVFDAVGIDSLFATYPSAWAQAHPTPSASA
jgi:tRNA synthetases class II core domain (F)